MTDSYTHPPQAPTPSPGAPQSAGASLSDILSAIKNLVTAVNALAQNYLNVEGLTNSGPLAAPTVVKASAGRVARVSVTTAGSTVGMIYDGASLSATLKPMYPIPDAVGVTEFIWPMAFGILVVPGTGQTVSVSYS
jgi:hypothetical protein